MNNIKDLTDVYMWMVANDYAHNIRIRVEKKAEMYLKTLKQGKELPIHYFIKCVNCKMNGMQQMNDSPCNMLNECENTCSNYNEC